MTSSEISESDLGPPSLGFRFLAAVIDFLLVLFIALPFVGFDSRIAVWTAEIAIVWIYRRLFGATPGQQLVGIRSDPLVRGLRLSTTSRRKQWLRAIGAILLVLYLGLTISAGVLIADLTDEKIDAPRVSIMPTDVVSPRAQVAGEREEFERISVLLPRTISGFAVEDVNCCALYGGGTDSAILQPGVFIAAMNDLHPCEYCRGVVNRTAGWLAGCGANPVEYQQAIVEATRAKRLRALSPIDVVRTNFALIAKSIYLEELTPGSELRRFRSGDAEVLWMRGKRTIKKTKETVQVDIDRFLLADATSYAAIDIVWKKVPRDDRMVEAMAASIRLRKPNDADVRRELTAATTGNAVFHLTNAFRMSGHTPEAATRLRELLAREGTARQKRYFAILLKSDAEHRPELREIAASVSDWQ